MREVTTTVYCDRCGKKIEAFNYGLAVKVYKAAENCLAGITEDLCADCAVSFKQWLYEGKNKDES